MTKLNQKFSTLGLSLCVSLIVACAGPCLAAPAKLPRYSARVDQKKGILHLFDRRAGRTLWSHRIRPSDITVNWSIDHKSVAINTHVADSGVPQIWLWREGYPLTIMPLPGDMDYNMASLWSPDGRRVIVRPGASASADVGPEGAGSIYVLHLQRRGRPRVSKKSEYIWKARWVDSRTIAYWLCVYSSFELLPQRHLWRV